MKGVKIEFFTSYIVFRKVIFFIYQKIYLSDRVPLRGVHVLLRIFRGGQGPPPPQGVSDTFPNGWGVRCLVVDPSQNQTEVNRALIFFHATVTDKFEFTDHCQVCNCVGL